MPLGLLLLLLVVFGVFLAADLDLAGAAYDLEDGVGLGALLDDDGALLEAADDQRG